LTAPATITIALADHPWLADHCPTYVIPALPMMSLVELLAGVAIAHAPGRHVVGLEDVRVFRWVTIADRSVRLLPTLRALADGTFEVTLATPAVDGAAPPRPVARARVRLAATYPESPPALAPLTNAVPSSDPYADASLFHGSSFRVLSGLRRGAAGASFDLDAGGGRVPGGLLNPGLLDGLLHGVPHDRLDTWFAEADPTKVAYPQRIDRIDFFAPTPRTGTVRGEVRGVRFDADAGLAHLHGQILAEGHVWVDLRFAEAMLPKGPIGMLAPLRRRSFLRDRTYVSGARLSRTEGAATVLTTADVAASNWLPGTLERAYRASGNGIDLVRVIAVKEHAAHALALHPSRIAINGDHAVAETLPLNRFPLRIAEEAGRVSVTDAGPPELDTEAIRREWRRWTRSDRSPVEDLYVALLRRFVARVAVEDVAALDALRDRPFLFLSNHQTGVESPLFALAATCLTRRPVITLAKREHQESWMGDLISLCEAYPGVHITRPMIFFDRNNPADMLRLRDAMMRAMREEKLSLMVHVEGTRSLHCREPVSRISSVFLDLAAEHDVPIVPVRFMGGLPVTSTPGAKRLDFPLGLGRQDIYIGRPIPQAALRDHLLADSKRMILAAINGVGPDLAVETPNPPDPAFAERVAAAQVFVPNRSVAAVAATIAADPEVGASLRAAVGALLAGRTVAGGTPEDDWLVSLAELMRRPY
jgi:1-acyl-sn-glycerol-3-phosphate acyltransferase